MNDKFWSEDINILFHKNNISKFIPHKDMNNAQKLNAIVRFSFYLSLILVLLKKNYLYFYITIITLVLTYMIYIFSDKIEKFNDFNISNQSECVLPNKDNPFMNPLLTDNPKRPRACNYKNPKINKLINKNFKSNLFRNIEDVYDRRNSQRQFYTLPSTTIPNDQDTFSKWLYKTPPTCKENNGNQCISNINSPIKGNLNSLGNVHL